MNGLTFDMLHLIFWCPEIWLYCESFLYVVEKGE